MSKFIARFVKNQSGATAIEYGLIAALIAVAIIAGAGSLGTTLNAKFGAIATQIGTGATTSTTTTTAPAASK